jgi:hypothetical protein
MTGSSQGNSVRNTTCLDSCEDKNRNRNVGICPPVEGSRNMVHHKASRQDGHTINQMFGDKSDENSASPPGWPQSRQICPSSKNANSSETHVRPAVGGNIWKTGYSAAMLGVKKNNNPRG